MIHWIDHVFRSEFLLSVIQVFMVSIFVLVSSSCVPFCIKFLVSFLVGVNLCSFVISRLIWIIFLHLVLCFTISSDSLS